MHTQLVGHVGAYSIGGSVFQCRVFGISQRGDSCFDGTEAIKTDGECHNFNLDNIEKQKQSNLLTLSKFLPDFYYLFYVLYVTKGHYDLNTYFGGTSYRGHKLQPDTELLLRNITLVEIRW